jgi:hypothetical protein
MKYSVNVDFETPNRQGGSTDCREHGKVGPHYDITVHVAGCSPHERIDRPQRYWKDFETVEEAKQFANARAAQPGRTSAPNESPNRTCKRCRA